MKKRFISIFFILIFLTFHAASASKPKQKTLDLTKLGTTMLYAQVFNMLMEAENFNGTKIKMNGIYYENKDVEQGPLFQCIIVTDVAGCCSAGLDLLKSNESLTFPKHLTEIEVEGTFIVKEIDGVTRSYLVVDNLSVL